jgi:hypothetical protein
MLIVSQDKEEIVNFDKVESIWICSDEEGRFTIEATADTNSTLGYYETKERAKEILEEIVKEYENVKAIFDCTTRKIKNYINKPKVYKMPKE